MSGKREDNKRQRRLAVLSSARSLFSEYGYNSSTIEKIAEKAGVSTPTIFNYFGNKREIIRTLIDDADIQAIQDLRPQLRKQDDAVDVLITLYQAIMEYEMNLLPPAVWREILSTWPDGFAWLGNKLTAELAEVIADMQKRVLITRYFSSTEIADFIDIFSNQLFTWLMFEENMDLPAHYEKVRRLFTMLVLGIGMPRPK